MKPLLNIAPLQPICTSANCCMHIQHEEGIMMKKKKCCEKFKKKGKRCKKCPGKDFV